MMKKTHIVIIIILSNTILMLAIFLLFINLDIFLIASSTSSQYQEKRGVSN